jgi:hypothetical protein
MENNNLKKKNAPIASGLLLVIISITILDEEQALKYLCLLSGTLLLLVSVYLKTKEIKNNKN